MKKVLVSVVLVLVMVATVVSAAAGVNGQYDGYDIVKLKANGQTLAVEDVPAFVYKGRTMVPVGMLRQAGLEVNWNQDEYSVDVIISSSHDLNLIRMYKEVMLMYFDLESLGDTINDTINSFLISFDGIQDQINIEDNYNLADDSINNLIAIYNSRLDSIEIIIENADTYDIHVQDSMYEIMNNYFDSIEYLKLSYDELLYFDNSAGNLDRFYDNINEAHRVSSDAQLLSLNNMINYADKIGQPSINDKIENTKNEDSYDFEDAVQELGFTSSAFLTVDARELALKLVEIRKTKNKGDYSVQDALIELGIPSGSTPTLETLKQAVKLLELK